MVVVVLFSLKKNLPTKINLFIQGWNINPPLPPLWMLVMWELSLSNWSPPFPLISKENSSPMVTIEASLCWFWRVELLEASAPRRLNSSLHFHCDGHGWSLPRMHLRNLKLSFIISKVFIRSSQSYFWCFSLEMFETSTEEEYGQCTTYIFLSLTANTLKELYR